MKNDIHQYNNKQWVAKYEKPRHRGNNWGSKWKYKAEFINYLVRRIDIVDLIEDIWMPAYIKRKSITHWKISPFSPYPSSKGRPFGASRKKRIFKCYSTGNGGGIIKFVQLLFGYNKKEAITYLVIRYNINTSNAILETEIVSDSSNDLPF